MKKIIIPFIGIISIITVIIFLYYNEITYFITDEKIQYEVYHSPKNQHSLTLLLHTVGSFHYTSTIYIIPGEYRKRQIPEENVYIKFPDATGVFINWEKENVVDLYCSDAPITNNFTENNYQLKIIIDRNLFDKMIAEGEKDKFIRYKIH